MELFPTLRLGWLNGWLLLVVLYGVFGLLLWVFPREVVTRLYDRSGWSPKEQRLVAMRLPFALLSFALIILTPLKWGTGVFVLGTAVFVTGLLGFVVALLNFRDTPADQPAEVGLYRLSRNPQAMSLILATVGICLAIGSSVALLTMAITMIFGHFRILAEEATCLRQYGESYHAYMQRVPRYFLFF
jgi:protein-S-isoprenylcysteine O-methyltransferase Ste14